MGCSGTETADDTATPATAVTEQVAGTPTDTVAQDATVNGTGNGTVDADAADAGGVVPAALQFTAPLVGGGEIVGDELAGKPTAFWFWSPT